MGDTRIIVARIKHEESNETETVYSRTKGIINKEKLESHKMLKDSGYKFKYCPFCGEEL